MTTYDEQIGTTLVLVGTTFSVVGALANSLILNHILAMQLWMIANPVLALWAYGNYYKRWNGGLSIQAIAVMYVVFTITNYYGLYYAGQM